MASTNRIRLNVSTALIVAGLITLLGTGLWCVFTAPIAVAAKVAFAGAILFVVGIIAGAGADPYK